MEKTVSDFVIEYLRSRGTRYIFGILSHTSFALGDSISRCDGMRLVNSAHEGGAGNMALGYARTSRGPGVCLVSAGGGVTNLATPIAQAYKESVPLLALSSEIETRSSSRGAASWHDIDHVGLLRPVTKDSVRLERAEDIPHLLNGAFRLLTTGRPGPVYLGIPSDLQEASILSEAPFPAFSPPSRPAVDPESLERAAEALIGARSPVMLIGTGVYWAGAESEARELAELLNVPVTTSYTAKGLFPENHPLALGCLGSGGRPYAREVFSSSDVILALGTTFSEGTMMGFDYRLIPRTASIIHIDIDPKELGKDLPNTTSIHSDAKVALQGLLGSVRKRLSPGGPSSDPARAQGIRDKKAAWKQQQEASGNMGKITKPLVYRTLGELGSGRHIFVTAGVTGSLLTHLDALSPVIHAGEFRAIGTALATAMGAKLGQPDKRVVCVTGDGSFLMEQQELATARLHNIPVLLVVLRNNSYGGMKRDQIKHYDGRAVGTDLFVPDLQGLAGLYGATGIKVTRPQDLRPVFEKSMASDDLVVVDVELGE